MSSLTNRNLVGCCVLVCCIAALLSATASQAGATRLLSVAEMERVARGAAPTDPCTSSITSYRCSDDIGVCEMRTKLGAGDCATAASGTSIECSGCTDYDRLFSKCTGTTPLKYRNCTESDGGVTDGCGTTRTGLIQCAWNVTDSYCMCAGGAGGGAPCPQTMATGVFNCIEQPSP